MKGNQAVEGEKWKREKRLCSMGRSSEYHLRHRVRRQRSGIWLRAEGVNVGEGWLNVGNTQMQTAFIRDNSETEQAQTEPPIT